MRVLGYYTFLLSDGQVWNFRKLKPYRRHTEEEKMPGSDEEVPPAHPIAPEPTLGRQRTISLEVGGRRTPRHNKGIPPKRLIEES